MAGLVIVARWALSWRAVALWAPRIIIPIGPTMGVRMYSDACTADGGLGGVACSANRDDVLTVSPKGAAEGVWIRGLLWTKGIYGEEMFALVPAVVALSEQLGGKRVALSIDNNAAAGALIKASSRVPVAWE